MNKEQQPSESAQSRNTAEVHKDWPELLAKLKLKKQFESQLRFLNEHGFLSVLPEQKTLGFIGIDGNTYPAPSYEQLVETLQKNVQPLQQAVAEGYTELALVPFGMPLDQIAKKYLQLLKKHSLEGKLFRDHKKKERLPLDLEKPLRSSLLSDFASGHINADSNQRLHYFPTEFSVDQKNGRTKLDLLQQHQPWQVYLINPQFFKTKNTHTKSHRMVEDMFSPSHKVFPEEGYIPELWFLEAIKQLQTTNTILVDTYFLGCQLVISDNTPGGLSSTTIVTINWNFAKGCLDLTTTVQTILPSPIVLAYRATPVSADQHT